MITQYEKRLARTNDQFSPCTREEIDRIIATFPTVTYTDWSGSEKPTQAQIRAHLAKGKSFYTYSFEYRVRPSKDTTP